MDQSQPSHIIELKARSSDDPDGIRAATILDAYFHAEHTKTFRRLLWRRLALLAAAWSLIGLTTGVLSKDAVLVGIGLFGGIAAWVAFAEWRASERLNRLVPKR
jgi:hypothetical protein